MKPGHSYQERSEGQEDATCGMRRRKPAGRSRSLLAHRNDRKKRFHSSIRCVSAVAAGRAASTDPRLRAPSRPGSSSTSRRRRALRRGVWAGTRRDTIGDAVRTSQRRRISRSLYFSTRHAVWRRDHFEFQAGIAVYAFPSLLLIMRRRLSEAAEAWSLKRSVVIGRLGYDALRRLGQPAAHY